MASGSNLGIADATYRRLRLDPPAQCVAQAQKAANIGRHIQALEDTHRELMAIQDRLDFELIVADDGSGVATRELIEAMAQKP